MTITLSFSAPKIAQKGTLVIPLTEKQKRTEQLDTLDKQMGGALSRAINVKKFTGKKGDKLSLLVPHGTQLEQIILIGLGDAKALSLADFERLGGTIAHISPKGDVTLLFEPLKECTISHIDCAARIALGAKLSAYRFSYRTRPKNKAKDMPAAKLVIATDQAARIRTAFKELDALADGICLARDLVNEPSNILTPPEFARRAKTLKQLGVKVEVLSEAQMKKQGMGALLGVGQGSAQPSQLVVMQWNGAAKTKKPLAFIGKGVCFDTGGISIKPSGGMEEMKGDMGGAAAVTGLLHALAKRKAKVNVVGILGLVENMPSGTAQRPGDIVTSMSGQTIEVLNTDAEGRLVLADALWYTQKRFKPKFMIDLATLTGAIIISLGQEYAGMFSDNDALAAQLNAIGEIEQEKVWRMPLCDNFDKMINSPNADMKNIGGGRNAGSSTAAHFLRRFTNNVPWVHLDIAGTAMGSPKNAISKTWASGFGVKLLDRLVKAHYE